MRNKWRQEQVCEAAGKELFGHFKVGKRSLGSNASLLDGLKEKKGTCLFVLTSADGKRNSPKGSLRAWKCRGVRKNIWIQVSALLQIFFGNLSKSLTSSLPRFPICKICLKRRCLYCSKVLEVWVLEIMKYLSTSKIEY